MALSAVAAVAVLVGWPTGAAGLQLSPVIKEGAAQPQQVREDSPVIKEGAAQPQQVREDRLACGGGDNRLNFMHIPKTGGSSIELAAADQNIFWGRFKDWRSCRIDHSRAMNCPAWHVPPSAFRSPSLLHPYAMSSTFCVVRSPYDRAISEYSYMVDHPQYRWRSGNTINRLGCSPEGLNDVLAETLRVLEHRPYQHLCHFLPQSSYVWGAAAPPDPAQQYCNEVLRLEDFPTAFDSLMQRYGLSISLPATPNNAGSCNLSSRDLNATVVDMIRKVYAADFQLLNYSLDIPTKSTGTNRPKAQSTAWAVPSPAPVADRPG